MFVFARPEKTIQRAYGGSRFADCAKDLDDCAFLTEEIVKEFQQRQK